MRIGEPMPQIQAPTSRPDSQGHREEATDDVLTCTVRQQERINLMSPVPLLFVSPVN